MCGKNANAGKLINYAKILLLILSVSEYRIINLWCKVEVINTIGPTDL